jgi:hypothetical protein
MSKRDEQIARMKGLMTYGISNTPKKTPVTESVEGPDGKIYAVIREGAKFYIKSTQKGSELVAESFDYIGGFMNKKNNEFSSYNQASKHLELKVRSLNEAYGVNKAVELLNPEKKEELMVEMTDAMKTSLARYRQIMNNAATIMNESSAISPSNTGNPEAPKTTSFSPKLGGPFEETAEATLDKDIKATASNPEKQGEPFGVNKKTEEYKDAQYVPDGSVANQKPKGGKVVRVNENEDFEETIEECDEWGSCGLPSSEGVGEIGDDEPFTTNVNGTLEEGNVDSFVGFADDNNSIEESDEENDIDLDDIDIDLDSDDMDDEEIDDIDTEETLEDELDAEESEENEIESLKNEIDELRTLVNQLMDKEDDTDEDDIEIEIDSDDMDDEEIDDIDTDDYDAMDDEEIDDTMIDSDDYDAMDESRTYVQNLLESSIELPFPVKVRNDELTDRRGRYGLGALLMDMMNERGGNDNDKKIIGFIKGKLYEILQCDYELRACMKNNHLDDDDWFEIITTMESNTNEIGDLVNKISFLTDSDMSLLERRLAKLAYYVEKYSNYYDENINPDYEAKVEDDEDLSDEFDIDDEYEYDDEEGMTDDEMDDAAYKNAGNEDEFSLDLSGDEMYDSVTPRRLNEEGTRLNVFGKHPGYRKKVMTLPQTGSDKEGNYEDWNDDSVYSEQPFGEEIGDSAPYEKTIDNIIESVFMNFKKKL